MSEVLPHKESNEVIVPQLTLKQHNAVQSELMRRSGDLKIWLDKNSDRFRRLVESSPEIRQLIIANQEQVFEEIEQILEKWEDNENS